MSLENPMKGKKKASEKKPESVKDLGRTAVLEMPDDFEDDLLTSKDKPVFEIDLDEEDEPVFEIDLDEPDEPEAKLNNARETLEIIMPGANTARRNETPITTRLSKLTPEERSQFSKNLRAQKQERQVEGSTPIRADSQRETELVFDLNTSSTAEEQTSDLGQKATEEMPRFPRELIPEDQPNEVAQEYQDLSSEQIESLAIELRQNLVKIANQSESANEVLEKQNEFIIEHAQKLGFPENLAKRLIANGRRILPIAPLAVQGGMSAVFESMNVNSDPDMLFGTNSESDLSKKTQTDILKVLYGAKAKPSLLQRFKQEGIASANLNVLDKHIVNVRDADFESPEAGYFMVLEKAEGNDLNQEISTEKLSPEKVVSFGLDIANAIKTIHEAGVIHRDIKPANIFVHREELRNDEEVEIKETVKVADFGLMKVGAETKDIEGRTILEDLSLSSAGSTIGTPLYQAPEVFLGKEESAQTDIYSLGITFYQLLTKKLPYNDMTSYKGLVSSATEGNIVELSQLVKNPEYADIPPALAELIDEMIEVNPEERPTIDEIIERLEQLNNGIDPASTVVSPSQGGRLPIIKEELPAATQGLVGKLKSFLSRK